MTAYKLFYEMKSDDAIKDIKHYAWQTMKIKLQKTISRMWYI